MHLVMVGMNPYHRTFLGEKAEVRDVCVLGLVW